MRRLLLRASRSRWLRERATRSRMVRASVRRFMPGEDLDSALAAAAALARAGLASVLTRLGEDLGDLAEAERTRDHYLQALERVARSGLDAEISVKPTQLGLDVSAAAATSNLLALARRAAERDGFVWIDMESSAHLEGTLELFRAARASYENVGVCLQAYLRRTPRDLESLLPLRPAIRLVKGAYAEPRDLAFPRKKDVDESFARLADTLLQATARGRAHRPAFGTHDTRLLDRVAVEAADRGVARDAYEIQMLYGIRTDEQDRYARAGHRVRALISYGEAWYPWYLRRLAERPANLGFVLRQLLPAPGRRA